MRDVFTYIQKIYDFVSLQRIRERIFGRATQRLHEKLLLIRTRLKTGNSALSSYKTNKWAFPNWLKDNAYFMALLVIRAWAGFIATPFLSLYGYFRTTLSIFTETIFFIASQLDRIVKPKNQQSIKRREQQQAWMRENYASMIRVMVLGLIAGWIPIIFPALYHIPLIAFPAGFILGKPIIFSLLHLDAASDIFETPKDTVLTMWESHDPNVIAGATTIGGLRQAVTILNQPKI